MKNILYIIKSHPGNFKTKLAEQASAWINDACDSCILVTSSMNLGPATKSDENKIIAQNIKDHLSNFLPQGIKRTQVLFSDCPKGHDTEPACTEANALLYAFYENQIKFDWVFVMDDDALVFPAELSKVLETRDRNYVYGIPGCEVDISENQPEGGIDKPIFNPKEVVGKLTLEGQAVNRNFLLSK